MKTIAATPRDRLNVSAGAAPVRRVVKRGLDLELLNGFGRRHGQRFSAVKGKAVGVNAVDLEIVLSAASAVDRDALRVAAQSGVVGQRRKRARRERENLCEVARR